MTLNLTQLHEMDMAQLKREQGRTPDPKSWRWSPSDIRVWDGMLRVAYDYMRANDWVDSPISIWEAGSGIGTKLYWAKHHYGMTEYGFELFPDYIKQAKVLGVACEQRDLSDMDNQPSWEVPDIVFTARPFKNDLFENAWERYVQNTMRPGAVLISTFTARKPYGWRCLYRATFRGVWVKPVSSEPEPVSVQNRVTSPLENSARRGKPLAYDRRRTSKSGGDSPLIPAEGT